MTTHPDVWQKIEPLLYVGALIKYISEGAPNWNVKRGVAYLVVETIKRGKGGDVRVLGACLHYHDDGSCEYTEHNIWNPQCAPALIDAGPASLEELVLIETLTGYKLHAKEKETSQS